MVRGSRRQMLPSSARTRITRRTAFWFLKRRGRRGRRTRTRTRTGGSRHGPEEG